jgi:hypothetical protein
LTDDQFDDLDPSFADNGTAILFSSDRPDDTLRANTDVTWWHARKDITVEYVTTDAKRESIPYVRMTDARGQVTEYFAPDTKAPPAGETRRMDCLDCHTRPAHTFSPTRRTDNQRSF